jgi:hypothetical protein
MCIAYSFSFVWLHFSGHVYCIPFGVVFFGSLYIQVIQGFIHADHDDLINKHVMMMRVTDNRMATLSITSEQAV